MYYIHVEFRYVGRYHSWLRVKSEPESEESQGRLGRAEKKERQGKKDTVGAKLIDGKQTTGEKRTNVRGRRWASNEANIDRSISAAVVFPLYGGDVRKAFPQPEQLNLKLLTLATRWFLSRALPQRLHWGD